MKLIEPAYQFVYKIIADEATMAILLVGPDHKVLYANKLARELLEFGNAVNDDGSPAVDFNINEIYPPNKHEKRIQCLNGDMLEMQGLIQEVLVQKTTAQTFIATLGNRHVEIEGQRHFLLMIQDVTLQKKLQREISEKQSAIQQAYQDLLHQNVQLKELDSAKDRFVAITTHELRTPVSAVLAAAEILKTNLYDNKTQHDEFVAMIFEQAQHMLDLVNDILDFAKIQANKMDYYVEQRDLISTVAREVESMKTMAKNSQVDLQFISTGAPALCYFDEVRAKQVITNLISNAIKYNVPNGKVRVEIKSSDEFYEVHIQDTGRGIAVDDYAKIFNEFETLGKIGNHSKGTGLGLSISQRMIRRMGGEIHLTSELGKGSNFWFTLPRRRVLDEADYRSRDSSSDDLAA